MESPFSRLPNELIFSILFFASGRDELGTEGNGPLGWIDVIKHISNLKLVCSTFAAFGNELLLKFEPMIGLARMRFEPTQKCLNMVLAVSRNAKLRSLIECLGRLDWPRLRPDWPNFTSELEGTDQLPHALGSFPRLDTVACSEYPSPEVLDTRLEEVTALFAKWLMIAAAAVSASPTDSRPLSIILRTVPFDFLCGWPLQSLSLEQRISEQRISSITLLSIKIDQHEFDGSPRSWGSALKLVLAAATSLESLWLEYMPPAPDFIDEEVGRFISDCLRNQHWKSLVHCTLLFQTEDWILLPFLERHADTVADIALFINISRCVTSTVSMLDEIKDFLRLQRASVLVTTDEKYCSEEDCDCVSRLLPILNKHTNELGDWDIGHYLLDEGCTYDDSLETWVRTKMSSSVTGF